MTDHVARLYALVAGVVVFFVAWAAVAAHPWQGSTTTAAAADPRLAALAARQHQLRLESLRVQRIVERRWAAYRVALHKRNAAIAAAQRSAATVAQSVSAPSYAAAAPPAPAVNVVTLPAQVITRTS